MGSIQVQGRWTWAAVCVAAGLWCACEPRRPYDYTSEVSISADSLLRHFNGGNESEYLDRMYRPLSERTILDRVRYWNAIGRASVGHFDQHRLRTAVDSAGVYLAPEEAKVHMLPEYAYWVHLTGVLYEEGKQFDKAYQAFALARLVRKRAGLPCADFEYADRISNILYHQKRYDLALEYYKKTNLEVDLCHIPKDAFHVKQGALSNIGISFYRSGMPDSALAYYDKAFAYLDEMGPKLGIDTEMHHGVVYGNQAQALSALGRDEEAEEAFLKSIEINVAPGRDISHAVLMMGRLSQFYLARGQYAEAKPWLDRIKPLIPQTTRNEISAIWNESMWRYYEGVGDLSNAHRYLKIHKDLSDSTAAATAVMFKTDVLDAYNNLEYESRMTALAQERDIQRGYLLASLLGFFLMGGLVVAIHRSWRASREHVAVLESLNRRIDEQKVELQVLVDQLRHRDEEKNKILWMVAHDLRNPIGAVVSLAEFMEDEPDVDIQAEYVEQIKTAATTSLSLIRDILQAADSSGPQKMEAQLKDADLRTLVARTVGLCRFRAAEKGQIIRFVPSERPAIVRLDEDRASRAVGNVLANAVKFSPAGSEVDVELRIDGQDAVVEVRDSGIGIPAEMREGVYAMFTDKKRAGTAGEQAFGLGLYIAKQVMEQHGGHIWFEDNHGGGTTFFLSFPLAGPEA